MDVYSRLCQALALLAVSLACLGCSGLKSRYAMENPVYAEKYADGAEKTDLTGKLKQASDARWVEDHDGMYFGGGLLVAPDSGTGLASLSIGHESYPESWLSTRAGFEGIATTSARGFLFGGADAGVRAQTPSRFAPFVGVGAGAGVSVGELILNSLVGREDDDIDHNGFASVYPEVGVHYWLNGQYRVTILGKYMMTTAGRRHDGWLLGGQLSRY